MGWTVGITVASIVMVLGAALAVAVHDHRHVHTIHLTVAPSARVRAFPWSRALHHEALILTGVLLGVVLLDHLVSVYAVPAALTLGGWPVPPAMRSLSSWLQGWALILGLQAVLVHALRQSFRDWRRATGRRGRATWHVLRDALPLVVMATVGAWVY